MTCIIQGRRKQVFKGLGGGGGGPHFRGKFLKRFFLH